MTQEEKELLLKDLSARLPYKVVAQVTYKDSEGWKTEDRKVLGVYTDGQVYVDCVYTNIENTKPYLRSLSSMTEEEDARRCAFLDDIEGGIEDAVFNYIDWLNKHHFDYRGLIDKGLALEAPEGMYKRL